MKGALATLDDDQAIAEIASGVLLKQLAEKHGVCKSSIYERLSKHPDYPQAVKSQASSIVETATAAALSEDLPASTPHIARARLRVDAAHKWAAARDPATWSGKPDLNLGGLVVNVLQFVAGAQQSETDVTQNVIEHKHIFRANDQSAPQQCATSVARQQLMDRLASLTDDQLASLISMAETPTRSPVPPGLVDSGGR